MSKDSSPPHFTEAETG